MLTSEEKPPLQTIVKNLVFLLRLKVSGPGRIKRLLDKADKNTQFSETRNTTGADRIQFRALILHSETLRSHPQPFGTGQMHSRKPLHRDLARANRQTGSQVRLRARELTPPQHRSPVPGDRPPSTGAALVVIIKSQGVVFSQRDHAQLQNDWNGSNCEKLNVSKSGPLYRCERTSMGRVATSLMGQSTKSLRDSPLKRSAHLQARGQTGD
jgi:hypothetical protein